MECKKDKNLENCTCSYGGCAKKGVCCDCIQYHLQNKQLPGCCFPQDAKRPTTAHSRPSQRRGTYNLSMEINITKIFSKG